MPAIYLKMGKQRGRLCHYKIVYIEYISKYRLYTQKSEQGFYLFYCG